MTTNFMNPAKIVILQLLKTLNANETKYTNNIWRKNGIGTLKIAGESTFRFNI